MGVNVRVVGIRLGLQSSKPDDKDGNIHGGISALMFPAIFFQNFFLTAVLRLLTYFYMRDKNVKPLNLTAIGQTLVKHAHKVKLEEKRGVVVELFPFIFEASARMSARAISRYLKEQHGVKLSAVTISKALSDLKKSWNQYFDVIEPFAKVFEKGSYLTPMSVFLFDDEAFNRMFDAFPIRAYKGHWLDLKALCRITIADVEAANILRDKWVSIGLDIRLKARPYIEHRLNQQTAK
jgi:hypothetical protein